MFVVRSAFEASDAAAAVDKQRKVEDVAAHVLHSHHGGEHGEHQHNVEGDGECSACSAKKEELQLHVHDDSIGTCVLEISAALDLDKLKHWLAQVLWDEPGDVYSQGGSTGESKQSISDDQAKAEASAALTSASSRQIFRMKAILSLHGQENQFYLQGVSCPGPLRVLMEEVGPAIV